MKKVRGYIFILVPLVLLLAFLGSVAFQTAAVFPPVVLGLLPFIILLLVAYNQQQEEATGLKRSGPVNPWQPISPPHYGQAQVDGVQAVNELKLRLSVLREEEEQLELEIENLDEMAEKRPVATAGAVR
ncbi:MAG TPA: hypothetical protein VH186_09420 [Chloroflexia bacterium]|nr:hypothetical protein [Chloroflexia bacterium]